jgi:hypothetical protein
MICRAFFGLYHRFVAYGKLLDSCSVKMWVAFASSMLGLVVFGFSANVRHDYM